MKSRLMLLVGVAAIAAKAEMTTFYWNGQNGGNKPENAVIGSQFACWTNETQTTAVAATFGNEYVLHDSGTPQTVAAQGFQFPGSRLVVGGGAANVSPTVLLKTYGIVNWTERSASSRFMSVKDMRWYRGSLKCNHGETAADAEARRSLANGFSGRMEVVNTGVGSEYHRVGPNGSDTYGPRNVMLASNLVSEPDVVIEGVGLNSKGVEAGLGGVRVYLMGTNTAYKGSFTASGWLTYSLVSDNALGDPATPNAAALQLGTNGGFEIHPAAQLGTTRGVTLLAGAMNAYQTTHLASDVVTNRLAITGAGVPFRTIGSGKIIYAGAYSAGTWTVQEGTLEIDAAATFPADHKFVVKSGATLRLDSLHNGIRVEREAGSTVVYAPIHYDNATATAIPIDFRDAGVPALPFRITLTERVVRQDTVRFAVLKLPAGAAVTAADFLVDTESVNSPLTATVEVVDGVDGVMVYLNVTPTIVFTPEAAASGKVYALADTEYYDLTGGTRAYMWSDHEKAHGLEGHDVADYLVTNGTPGTAVSGWNGTMTFPGVSLAVRGPGEVTTRHMRAIFKRIYFGPGAGFVGLGCGYGDTPHWLQGEVRIGGTVARPSWFKSRWGFDAKNGYARNTTCIDGPLLGDGYLKFNGNSLADVRITSTNTSFTGGIFMETIANEITNCALAIRHPYTIGGPLPVNQTNYYSLVLAGQHAYLKPLETMTLERPGRGMIINAAPSSGFNVPEGVTLTVREPLRSVYGVWKKGLGTLALDCGWFYGEDGKGTDNGATTAFYLTEGALKLVNSTTLRGLKFFVRGDVTLIGNAATDDPVIREYGLYNTKNTSWMMTAGKTVTFAPEGLTSASGTTVRIPICTVRSDLDGTNTSAAERLRPCLRLRRVPGYRGTIVEDVPAGSSDMIRFTAVYERQGMAIIVK